MIGRVRLLAAAIAVTFLAGSLALAVHGRGKEKITITAYFSKAIGLFPQSTVRVLGVSVGRDRKSVV